MRFRIRRELLADAVAWGSRNVSPRPTAPVLAGALVEVSGGSLTISSFDYESSSRASVDVDVEADVDDADGGGRALVSGRLLTEITKALPDRPIQVTRAGAALELRCGNGRFKLPTMPVEDYPRLPDVPATVGTIDAARFAAAVGQIAAAVSRDESLPVLTGIRIEIVGDAMTLLASDRYRAARRVIHWQPTDPNLKTEILLPGRTLVDAAKAFAHQGGALDLALDQDVLAGGTVGLRAGGRALTGRLLDGTYPPIGTLFGVAHPTRAAVSVAALIEVVKRVALFAERTTPILLSLDSDGITVEAHGGQDAEASERVEASYDGQPVTLAFNEAYLLDGLTAMAGPTVALSYLDPLKPVALKPSEDPDFAYLLQPVRINR